MTIEDVSDKLIEVLNERANEGCRYGWVGMMDMEDIADNILRRAGNPDFSRVNSIGALAEDAKVDVKELWSLIEEKEDGELWISVEYDLEVIVLTLHFCVLEDKDKLELKDWSKVDVEEFKKIELDSMGYEWN